MPSSGHGAPSISSPPTTMNQSLMSSQKRVLYSECYRNLNQYALQKRGKYTTMTLRSEVKPVHEHELSCTDLCSPKHELIAT